jgi:putative membrane protein
MKLLIKWLICFGALAAAQALFPAQVAGGAWQLAIAGLVLFAVNLLIRPLAQLICLPVTILTLGLCHFVVNACMVGLTDAMLPFIRMNSFWVWLVVAFVITLGNATLLYVLHKSQRMISESVGA